MPHRGLGPGSACRYEEGSASNFRSSSTARIKIGVINSPLITSGPKVEQLLLVISQSTRVPKSHHVPKAFLNLQLQSSQVLLLTMPGVIAGLLTADGCSSGPRSLDSNLSDPSLLRTGWVRHQ